MTNAQAASSMPARCRAASTVRACIRRRWQASRSSPPPATSSSSRCRKDGDVTGIKLAIKYETFTISGTVVDDTGAPVADVHIEAIGRGRAGIDLPSIMSAADGTFRIRNLARGTYNLHAHACGRRRRRREQHQRGRRERHDQARAARRDRGHARRLHEQRRRCSMRTLTADLSIGGDPIIEGTRFWQTGVRPGKYAIEAKAGARDRWRVDRDQERRDREGHADEPRQRQGRRPPLRVRHEDAAARLSLRRESLDGRRDGRAAERQIPDVVPRRQGPLRDGRADRHGARVLLLARQPALRRGHRRRGHEGRARERRDSDVLLVMRSMPAVRAEVPGDAAAVWSCSIDWRISRETCIWETPTRSPISAWVSSTRSAAAGSAARGRTGVRVARRAAAACLRLREGRVLTGAEDSPIAVARRPRSVGGRASRGGARSAVVERFDDLLDVASAAVRQFCAVGERPVRRSAARRRG